MDEIEQPVGDTSDQPVDIPPVAADVAPVAREGPIRRSRTSSVWVAIIATLVVLVLLLIFILQNGERARVSFFGAHGSVPLGVALLLGAVIGGLLVAFAGAARILQIRARTRRESGVGRRRGRRQGVRAVRNRPAGPTDL